MIINRKNDSDKEIETLRIIINGSIKEIYEAYYVINNITKIVFEGILSCFGTGFWRNEKGWVNKEGWRNTIKQIKIL